MPARLICAAVVLALSMAPGAAWASCPRAPAADTGPVGAGTPRVAALEALREGAQACGPAAPQECTFQAGGITYQLFGANLATLRIPAPGRRLPYGIEANFRAIETVGQLRRLGLRFWDNSQDGGTVSAVCEGGQGMLIFVFGGDGALTEVMETTGNGGD